MLDNLSITLASAPRRVTDVKVDKATIGQNEATLSWKENGTATTWEVRLFSQKPEDIDTATPDKAYTAVTTNPLKVTGLAHSTYYYVYVRSVQGTETGAWSLVQNFWTATGNWSVPFYEDFNDYKTGGTTSNTLPPYYDVSASAAGNYPYVRSYIGASLQEKERVNIYSFTASSSKKVSQLELPPFDRPVNTLQMTLDACSYSTYGGVQSKTIFGVVTADGVFHTVATRELGATKVWEPWLVDFSSYTGEEGRIAIRQEYDAIDNKTVYIFIDNVKIDIIPQCKKIQDVKVKEVTQTEATISWTAAGEETAWNLKVSTTELEDPSAATADVFDGQMTTTTKQLTNLVPGTDYFVYVQSVRADKDCVGEWSLASTFTTLCSAMPRPYTETFDEMETSIVPPCYLLSGKVTDNTAVYTNMPTGASSQLLRLAQLDVTYNNYCAFPLVACNSIQELQLKMQVLPGSWGTAGSAPEKWSWYFYEIGVMTDPKDPATYVAVRTDSVPADGTKIPADKRYTFEKYAGDELGNKGKYIAIRVRPYRSLSLNKEYSGTLYIDNIEIGDKELCLQPTELRAPEYDNDTVRLTWKAEDKTGSFRVRVFTDAEAGPETFVAETVVTDTTMAVLKGLNGNTLYYASVRHECGGDNGNSKWSTFISWRSDCEDIQTLPYVDDFEYGVTNIVPYCWASITKTYDPSEGHGGGTSTLDAKIAKSNDNAYLNIGGSTTGGKLYAQAITPQLDIDNLSNALIYFDVKAAYADAQLRIEAIESTAEDAAAITIHTVEGIQSTKWQTVYLDLADYYTSAQPYKYLRLAPVAGKSVYIDNLHITTNKAEVLPVQDVKLKDLSLRATSVDISFTESTPGVAQWIVEYGPTGYEAGTGTSATVDTAYCRLTGLQPATAYDVYVRGNVEGSPWVGPLKFTTAKALATLPYYYGFEDAAENTGMWTLHNTNANGVEAPNTFTFGPAVNVDGTGTTSLYIRHNGEYGYMVKDASGNLGASSVWATRYIDIPAAGTYEIGLRAKSQGNLKEGDEDNDYFVVCLVPSDRIFSGSSIRRPDGTTGSATSTTNTSRNEFNLLPKTYGVTDYQMLSGKVVVANPGAYQLAIYWYNSSVGIPGKPVAVDSIYMKEYECTTPANHQLTNLTDSSATISWFAGKNDKFEVVASRYRRSPRPGDMDAADKLVHEIYTGKPSFTVDGLKPNTTYAFYQRTICSDGPTDWVEFDFTTNCVEESLPYIETFAETPPCWTYSSTAVKATTKKYLTDEMKAKGEEAEEWSCLHIPANGIAVLPDFGVDITKLAVQINAFNVPLNPAQLILGTVENTWDLTTFEQVAVCDLKTQYSVSSSAGNPLVLEHFEKFFNLYTGKGKYIALKAANVDVYIKSITVTELPDCITPQQVEVTDILESSATIHWLAGSEQSWRIACGGDTVTVSENPYTLTGLSQGQDYKVSVQALCDEDGQSAWSAEVAFTTQCGVNAMPLVDDFASRVRAGRNFNYTLANCWQQLLSTISFDSVAHRNKPAMEVLERLPKETNANQATYSAQKWYIPGQTHLDSSLVKRPHLASRFIYSSNALAGKTFYKWLILPAVTADENTFLTFDLALANIDGYLFYYKWSNKYNPIDLPDFRVVVSTDGGNTFKELQKINLNKYDSTFQNVSIDLSEYAGKDVQVGFYHPLKFTYSLQLGAPDIRLADIRINCTNSYSVEDNACVDYDYEGHGFAIAKEDLPLAGETKEFTRFAPSPAKEATECDSLITLTLTSHVAIADTIRMTICEGESVKFGDNELTEANPEGVPYVISGTTMFGCDSTTYLYLTVNPRAYTDLGTVVIKQGESYTGNGFTGLTEQGIYRDTLKTYQGCDSILSLHLEVLQPHTHWIDTVVCDNQLPFTWKGMTITEENVYRFDTLAQDPALDSIINLSVTVNAVSYNDMEEVVCEGETFSFGGLELSDPGTYKDTLVNRYGCDSVVTLVLSRLPITMVDVDTTVIITDLPFLYAGQEVLDANTAVGTYDIVVKDADAPCTRYNMHIQVVPDQTAIANINATSMSLYPTDIAVGQSVNLVLGGVPQTQKLKVEVCDMLGKCIATHTPATSHLVLNDFNATGIYIVRVVAEDGVYGVGRILVR
ncbi:MAG: fibronectin type III domain-containing protein [Paludibacteraceae bacterium]